MIISGGENIYCAEVENVLATHPKVADVALIGVPDTEVGRDAAGGRRRRATRPTADPEEIVEWCREHLAGYKRPRGRRSSTRCRATPAGRCSRPSCARSTPPAPWWPNPSSEHRARVMCDQGVFSAGSAPHRAHCLAVGGPVSGRRASRRSSRAARSRR